MNEAGKSCSISWVRVAELVLLSFAAFGSLPVKERALALGMPRTRERLRHALSSLQEQQRRLAALVALRDAAGGAAL